MNGAGIRPAWSAAQDQKRITTPKDAILLGATALVIGRPITNPPHGNIEKAVQDVLDEISDALTEKGV